MPDAVPRKAREQVLALKESHGLLGVPANAEDVSRRYGVDLPRKNIRPRPDLLAPDGMRQLGVLLDDARLLYRVGYVAGPAASLGRLRTLETEIAQHPPKTRGCGVLGPAPPLRLNIGRLAVDRLDVCRLNSSEAWVLADEHDIRWDRAKSTVEPTEVIDLGLRVRRPELHQSIVDLGSESLKVHGAPRSDPLDLLPLTLAGFAGAQPPKPITTRYPQLIRGT